MTVCRYCIMFDLLFHFRDPSMSFNFSISLLTCVFRVVSEPEELSESDLFLFLDELTFPDLDLLLSPYFFFNFLSSSSSASLSLIFSLSLLSLLSLLPLPFFAEDFYFFLTISSEDDFSLSSLSPSSSSLSEAMLTIFDHLAFASLRLALSTQESVS